LYVVADEADKGNVVLVHDLSLLFCPALLRALSGRWHLLPRPSSAVSGGTGKDAVQQSRSFWQETGNPEGRAAKVEERCAARAQEKLTACRARERAGRKRA